MCLAFILTIAFGAAGVAVALSRGLSSSAERVVDGGGACVLEITSLNRRRILGVVPELSIEYQVLGTEPQGDSLSGEPRRVVGLYDNGSYNVSVGDTVPAFYLDDRVVVEAWIDGMQLPVYVWSLLAIVSCIIASIILLVMLRIRDAIWSGAGKNDEHNGQKSSGGG